MSKRIVAGKGLPRARAPHRPWYTLPGVLRRGVDSYASSFGSRSRLETRATLAGATLLFAAVIGAAVLMLRASFYLGVDSAHSYAHVELLSRAIRHDHRIPLHATQLEGGSAIALPYAVIPWLPDALLHPIFGDWIVTASMGAGAALFLVATVYWRPALRRPPLLAILLANPYFWDGFLQFQLATFWSFAFVFFGAGRFERGGKLSAALLLGIGLAIHPLMGGAAVALWLVIMLAGRKVPLRHLPLTLAGALAIDAPFLLLFLNAPLVEDTHRTALVLSALDNLQRLSLIALPALVARYPDRSVDLAAPIYAAGAVLTAVWFWNVPPVGLWEASRPRFSDYLSKHPVAASDTYRVMTGPYHEDGMVEFLRAGAVLSNEFFTESERRQDFASADAYQCFLTAKHIDRVVLEDGYLARFRTNELQMLNALAGRGDAALEYRASSGTVSYRVFGPRREESVCSP